MAPQASLNQPFPTMMDQWAFDSPEMNIASHKTDESASPWLIWLSETAVDQAPSLSKQFGNH